MPTSARATLPSAAGIRHLSPSAALNSVLATQRFTRAGCFLSHVARDFRCNAVSGIVDLEAFGVRLSSMANRLTGPPPRVKACAARNVTGRNCSRAKRVFHSGLAHAVLTPGAARDRIVG